MLKLYYFEGACSLVPHVALEWAGLPYEIERVAHGADRDPRFLELNPLGAVPCLVDGDLVLTQNMAILEYIDDLRPQIRLMGGFGAKEKAETRKWLSIMNTDLHPLFSHLFRAKDMFDREEHLEAFKRRVMERIANIYDVVEKRLEGQERLTPTRTVVDPYLYVTLGWCDRVGLDMSNRPNLTRFREFFGKDEGLVKALRAQKEGAWA